MDKRPSEVQMYLKKQPFSPTINEFVRIKAQKSGIFELLKDLGVY